MNGERKDNFFSVKMEQKDLLKEIEALALKPGEASLEQLLEMVLPHLSWVNWDELARTSAENYPTPINNPKLTEQNDDQGQDSNYVLKNVLLSQSSTSTKVSHSQDKNSAEKVLQLKMEPPQQYQRNKKIINCPAYGCQFATAVHIAYIRHIYIVHSNGILCEYPQCHKVFHNPERFFKHIREQH